MDVGRTKRSPTHCAATHGGILESGVPDGERGGGSAAADARAMHPARSHTERPLYKMSVQLIDTYKLINKARAAARVRSFFRSLVSERRWKNTERRVTFVTAGTLFAAASSRWLCACACACACARVC